MSIQSRDTQHENSDVIKCPFCHTKSPKGVLVCKGCQAEVCYGASWLVTFLITLLFLIASVLWKPIFGIDGILFDVLAVLTIGFGLFVVFKYVKKSKNHVRFKRIMKT